MNCLLIVAALASAFALQSIRTIWSKVDVVQVAGGTRASGSTLADDAPRNFLLVGTDSAIRLDSSDPIKEGRQELNLLADVIMILRVDPKTQKAWLMSIPRDTTMDLSTTGEHRRINAAIQGEHGALDVIQTIKNNLGISIDHYIQVDFYAFKTIIDRLGGLPIYFNTAVKDKNTGLDVDAAGCRVLNPDDALKYARSRHMSYKDSEGDWKYEPTGDPGRAERQQQVIKLMLHQALAQGIRDPRKAMSLGTALAEVVTIDANLRISDMIDLGDQFRSFSADELQTFELPTEDYLGPQDASYQRILWDKASDLLDLYRGILPGQPVQPTNVIVNVLGTENQSTDVSANALAAAGFDAQPIVIDGEERTSTIVRYGDQGGEAAKLVARYLKASVDFRYDEDLKGLQIRVELGSDFLGVTDQPVAVDSLAPAEIAEVDQQMAEIAADTTTSSSEGSQASDSASGTDSTSNSDGSSTSSDTPSPIGSDATDTSATTSVDGTATTTQTGTSTSTPDAASSVPTQPDSFIVAGSFVPVDYKKSLTCK